MKRKPQIKLLVTDLDNTLYDWVSFFVPAFYAMVHVAADILGVNEEHLLDELQKVHRKYQNSEHPFALLETKSAREAFPHLGRRELAKVLDQAFHTFNRERKERLQLYPDVRMSLNKIKDRGTRVVAHTEARVVNSLFRVRVLGLDDVIERIYAPRSDGLGHPGGVQPEFAEWEHRLVIRLPEDHRKPDPRVLLDVCNDFGVATSETLYVGDSISRDIFMANRAGVHSAWAHYGGIYDPTLWQRLVRVTHWSTDDVERERILREQSKSAQPDVELGAFSEVLDHFDFARLADTGRKPVLDSGHVTG
jgi:phosphoglycolate phosphatase